MSDYQPSGPEPWDATPQPEPPPSPYPAGPGPYSGDPTVIYGAPGGYPPGAYPPPGYGPQGYGPQPYGQQPYGQQPYGPAGFPAPVFLPATTNGMSIAALVCGICGFFCVTPVLAVIFGFVGLNQIQRTTQRGRGMAIAGIVCGLAWIAVIIISVATGHGHFSTGPDPDPNPGP